MIRSAAKWGSESKQSPSDVEQRAVLSLGSSSRAVYQMVNQALDSKAIGSGTIVDVGCGAGNLFSYVKDRFHRYIGVDVERLSL